ncbi:hypothetical protein TNCV_3455501 [Trichonephila clavipes]|nr:hypothetical protein TNCV_3455501 [Trichonephila clavipes]
MDSEDKQVGEEIEPQVKKTDSKPKTLRAAPTRNRIGRATQKKHEELPKEAIKPENAEDNEKTTLDWKMFLNHASLIKPAGVLYIEIQSENVKYFA